jgi:hypothetical protein
MVARAPRKRMYRTMQGRMVDIEKLRAANESTRAVGNMNVNARGDVLGPSGQIITKKENVMKKYYEQPKGMVDDTPARAKPTPARRTPPTAQADQQVKVTSQPEVQVMTPMAPSAEPQQEAKKIVTPEVNPESKQVETFKPKTTTTAKSGIDAALDGLE